MGGSGNVSPSLSTPNTVSFMGPQGTPITATTASFTPPTAAQAKAQTKAGLDPNLTTVGISPGTQTQIKDLFASGYNPASAVNPVPPPTTTPSPPPPSPPPPSPPPPPQPPPPPVPPANVLPVYSQNVSPTAAVGGPVIQPPSWGPFSGQPVNQAGPPPSTTTSSTPTTTTTPSTQQGAVSDWGLQPVAMQGGNPMGAAMGTPMMNQFFNPNAMYQQPNQAAATQTANSMQTYLPGTLNSSNPWSINPMTNNAVGGYSPLTMQQQPPQQKMGGYNATTK